MTNLSEKDMVVLKRNDPKDENVYQDGDVPCLYNLYLTSDKNLYFFSCGKGWKLSAINDDDDYRKLLKPITKEPVMKEYLVKNRHDEYVFLNDVSCVPSEFVIEIPEGMNYAYKDEFNIHFTKLEMGYRDSIIAWQRETQSEALPFIDDEPKYDPEDIGIAKDYDLDELAKEYKLRDRCDGETDEEYRYMLKHCIDLENYIAKETLNDKVASAEVARQDFIRDLPEVNFEAVEVADVVDESNVEQTLSDRESTYGSFKDVAVTTRNIMNCIDVDSMNAVQQEALHMICSKLARIANGNPNHVDSWHDIAGYASLVVKDINGNP